METSAFRVSEERSVVGASRADAAWAWLLRHRRVVMWGVVLVLGAEGVRDLYDVATRWMAGDRVSAMDDLGGVPICFLAAWGVYRRPAMWGWRVGMLLVWVGAGMLVIGAPLVWWIWRMHPEAQGWWKDVSMDGRDWLGVALHVASVIMFTAACLALKSLYAERKSEPGASPDTNLG